MSLFRQEAVDHKRRRIHGSVVIAQPIRSILLTAVLTSITGLAGIYLLSFSFERKESVAGYITSAKGVAVVRAPNAGMLSRFHVRIGDAVKAGDPLFESVTDVESTGGPTRMQQLATTDNRILEIDGQAAISRRMFAEQHDFLEKRRNNLRNSLARLSERHSLQQEILELASRDLTRLRTLKDRKHASDAELGRQLEVVLSHESDLAVLRDDIAERRGELELAEFELRSLPDKQLREDSEFSIAKSALLQSRYEQQRQAEYLVRAPIAGRISALQGTVGQSLSATSPVVTVVPANAALVANLLAPSRAIGFLAPQGEVNLMIDAFPFQKFGVQRGRITEVSESAYKPGELNVPIAYDESVHKVIVALENNFVTAYGKQVPLQVDMTLTGDLIVERRSLFEWMLEPLYSLRL